MPMNPDLLAHAEAARGFMPPDEGLALFDAAEAVGVDGPFLEVGSYCGKSSVYLGASAQSQGRLLFALDLVGTERHIGEPIALIYGNFKKIIIEFLFGIIEVVDFLLSHEKVLGGSFKPWMLKHLKGACPFFRVDL